MADTNWEAIKIEYITTDISQRKLSEKYGIPPSNIARRSIDEGWVQMREQYKNEVITKTLEKTSTKEAHRLHKLMNTTAKAIDTVVRAFADDNQFNRYIVEKKEKYASPKVLVDENGEVIQAISEQQWAEEKVFNKVDTKALKDMTAVLKDLTALMRDFYNIPTPAQAEAQRLAAERLELDKRKYSMDEEDDDETGVVLMPPVLKEKSDE